MDRRSFGTTNIITTTTTTSGAGRSDYTTQSSLSISAGDSPLSFGAPTRGNSTGSAGSRLRLRDRSTPPAHSRSPQPAGAAATTSTRPSAPPAPMPTGDDTLSKRDASRSMLPLMTVASAAAHALVLYWPFIYFNVALLFYQDSLFGSFRSLVGQSSLQHAVQTWFSTHQYVYSRCTPLACVLKSAIS